MTVICRLIIHQTFLTSISLGFLFLLWLIERAVSTDTCRHHLYRFVHTCVCMARSWHKAPSELECPRCDEELAGNIQGVSETQGGEKRTTCINCGTPIRLSIELFGTVVETEIETVDIGSSEQTRETTSTQS